MGSSASTRRSSSSNVYACSRSSSPRSVMLHGVVVQRFDRQGQTPHRSPPPVVLVLTIPRQRANTLVRDPHRGRRRTSRRRRRRRAAARGGRRGGRAGVRRRRRGRRRRRRRGAAPRDRRRAAASAPRPPSAQGRSTSCRSTQQVGRLVVLRFDGTSAPGYVREVLRRGPRGRRDPVPRQPHRPRAGAGADRPAAPRRRTAPPLICVDQEGGEIRILPWAPPERSAAGAGAPRAPCATTPRRPRATLRDTGINVSLAPVADVASVPGAALAGRAFSTDFGAARRRGRRVRARLAGGRRGRRPSSTSPGSAARPSTPTTGRRRSRAARSRSATRTCVPFRSAIEAGVPLVMAGHARLPRDRPRPDRLAVGAGDRRAAARRARLRGRGDHRLDRGRGGAGGHRRARRRPSATSARASTSCSPPAAAPTSRSTARCSPRRGATRRSASGCASRPRASWRSQRELGRGA